MAVLENNLVFGFAQERLCRDQQNEKCLHDLHEFDGDLAGVIQDTRAGVHVR